MVYSHDSFIANFKTFSIVTIINSKTFSDFGAWFYIDCESLCVWGPPYTTAPPCNAWGNAPVNDS